VAPERLDGETIARRLLALRKYPLLGADVEALIVQLTDRGLL
jgi:hypothetical protein